MSVNLFVSSCLKRAFFSFCVVFVVIGTISETRLHAEETKIYQYRGEGGRISFIDDKKRVPQAYKSTLKSVDVSHISTNTELGEDIKRATQEELDRLAETPYCKNLKKSKPKGFFGQLWDDYAVLIIIGVLLLLLLFFFTPMITRYIPGPQWSRTLFILIPLLVSIGLITTASIKANEQLNSTKENLGLCNSKIDTNSASTPSTTIKERLRKIRELREAIDAKTLR